MPAIEFMAKTPMMANAVGDAAGKAGAAATSQLVGATQTKFSVDLEQVPKLIKGLEDARTELEQLYRDAQDITTVNSPGKDVYSGFATIAVRETAGDNPGGYRWANKLARDALTETIKNIQDAVNIYKQTESGNKDSLKG